MDQETFVSLRTDQCGEFYQPVVTHLYYVQGVSPSLYCESLKYINRCVCVCEIFLFVYNCCLQWSKNRLPIASQGTAGIENVFHIYSNSFSCLSSTKSCSGTPWLTGCMTNSNTAKPILFGSISHSIDSSLIAVYSTDFRCLYSSTGSS